MGETNNLIQQFFSDNERFADLFNVYIGKQLIHASDLIEKDSQATAKAGKKPNQKTLGKYRDIVRKVAVGTDFILIGIENQTEINYAMPIRALMYDAISYDEQLRDIMKRNKQQKGLSSAEFLGGFRREDRVMPVVTVTLYYGRESWNGAVDLYEIMDLKRMSPEVRKLVHNYPINLLQIRNFEGVERFQTDLKAVFGFLQNSDTQEKLKNFIDENRQYFEELQEDAYDVIIQLSDSKELIKYKDRYREEGGCNMCRAIEEIFEDGINQGIKQGIGQGIIQGEAQGIIKGEAQGASRILRLTAAMVSDNCANQIIRLSTDHCFLQEMLLKYNI